MEEPVKNIYPDETPLQDEEPLAYGETNYLETEPDLSDLNNPVTE